MLKSKFLYYKKDLTNQSLLQKGSEKSILTNVKKKRTSIIKAHEKKLKNLSKNFTLPFTSDEVITNLSNYQISDTERDLLKYGLLYAVPPRSINKADIFTTFERLNWYLCTELKNIEDTEKLRAQLPQLANSYYSKYKPSTQMLKKHGILKKLRGNKDIVITHPDKGTGVVIMNRKHYGKAMYDILENNSKFKKLKKRSNLIKGRTIMFYLNFKTTRRL